MLKLYLLCLLLLLSSTTCAQRGVLGNQTIANQDVSVNSFAMLSANATAGAASIDVDDNTMNGAFFSGSLNQGDLILIMQMQGADVDINTTAVDSWGDIYTSQNSFFSNGFNNIITEYGRVLDYQSSGHFEYAEVAGTSGTNTINLNCGLQHDYDIDGHVQVIRIPRFEDLTIQNGASITSPPWDGDTGGVVALEINGDLTLTGTGRINADTLGFRGGSTDNLSATASSAGGSTGFLGSYEPIEGAEKGEGIFGTFADVDNIYSRYCRGAIANGGGGANYHNAGGGGGSNVGTGNYYYYGVPEPGPSNSYVTAWNLEDPNMFTNPSAGGGRGGYSHATSNNDPLVVGPDEAAWSTDYRRITGGAGGHPLNYDPERIFLGGGGGAGDDNDDYGGDGGRGGGIVMLQVYGDISGNGSITADGQDGGDATGPTPPGFSSQKSGDDGAGGAGGGGSIFVQNLGSFNSNINLLARGGDGGDQNLQLSTFASDQADGPGGGGSGGMIAITSGAPTQDVSGGSAGETNSSFVTNFPVNGATAGADGLSGLSNDMYELTAANDTVCGGGSTTLTTNINGSLPGGVSVVWYDAPYGGNLLNTGSSFTTPNLTATTTYYVGTCPGTYRIPVEVVVSPPINITGTVSITDETCAGNDGEITGLTASGGSGTLTFDWNGTTTPTEDLTNATGGNYTLTVTDQNGCTATSGPHTIGASPGPSIDLSGLTIDDESCLGNDGAITGIVATGSNLTFEWNGTTYPDEDITGITAGSYTLVVTDDASCTSSAGPFTVSADPGPVIDESNLTIVDETCSDANGEITGITASGSNITFEWNGNNATDEDTVGLAGGSYTLTVTDDMGCTATSGPHTVNAIPEPTIDDSNIQIQNEGCGQSNGSITGIIASGSNLSYLWNGNTHPQEDITNLPAGNYTLEVVDQNGCSVTAGPYTITNEPGPTINTSSVVVVDETCNGSDGEINGISVNGSGSFNYEWTPSGATTLDLNGVPAGTYVLEVTDGNNCTEVAGPFTIDSLSGPIINDNALAIQPANCQGDGGEITGLSANGGDLDFSWNGVNSSNADLIDISSGDYTLTVTDSNGCTANYGPVTVNGPVVPVVNILTNDATINAGGSVSIDASVQPNDASLLWTPAEGVDCSTCLEPTLTPDESGFYILSATSTDGCKATDSIFITIEDPCGKVELPSMFSPNGDDINDELCVLGGCIETVTFQVYNRWGEKIFETNDPTECWKGYHRGEIVNTGTYVYKYNGTRKNGESFSGAGNITVVK